MSGKEIPHILIVDDTPDILQLTSVLLQSLGATVVTAQTGAMALKNVKDSLSEDREFSLILMDIHMPDMNGNVTTEEIRKLGYQGPIIAFTANATMQGKKIGKEAGLTGYFSKAVLKKDVVAALLHEHCGYTPE